MIKKILIILLICLVYAAFQDGYNKFFIGDYEEAAEIFKSLVASNPKDYKNTLWLGKSYFYSGNQKNAIDTLIRAVKLKPSEVEAKELLDQVEYIRGHNKNAEVYYHKGYYAFMKAEYDIARENYWQAILLDPNVAKYHLWHLRSLIGLGELRKARAQLEYAETLNPHDKTLSILKKEDLRDIKPDSDYYNLLVSLSKKTIEPQPRMNKEIFSKEIPKEEIAIEEKLPEVEVVQPQEVVKVEPKIEPKIEPIIEQQQVIKAESITYKESKVKDSLVSNKLSTSKIIELNSDFESEIPTLNADLLRRESASFQGKTTKVRLPF